MNSSSGAPPAGLKKVSAAALAVGVIALAACVWGGFYSPAQFFRSYLIGYIFYCGIALGCLGILMMNHLTGGAWGLIPRRIIESAARTLPLLLVLFVPIVVGIPWLYRWAHKEAVAANTLLSYKRLFLNVPFFLIRSAAFFAIWIAFASLLGAWSRRQEREDPQRLGRLMRRLSGPGLFIYGLTASFAYFDWVMSLLPEWGSTIFGMLIVAGQALSAYAFVIVVLVILARFSPLAQAVSPALFHDLGSLLQAFVLLWAYLSFSQLLIIWAGNLPREIIWYVHRLGTSWRWLGVLLIIGHFALPFFLLLFRVIKRNAVSLAALSVFLLVMRVCDEIWLVEPDFHPQGLRLHWMDVIAPIGLGGVWVAFFIWLLLRGPLLPFGAPELAKALPAASKAAAGGSP